MYNLKKILFQNLTPRQKSSLFSHLQALTKKKKEEDTAKILADFLDDEISNEYDRAMYDPAIQKDAVELSNFIEAMESRELDIIKEQDLYHILCTAIIDMDRRVNFTPDNVPAYVLKLLGEYKIPTPNSRERLQKGLIIMLLAYISSTVKMRVESLIDEII